MVKPLAPTDSLGTELSLAACRPSRRRAHPVLERTGGRGARLVDVAGQAAGGEGRVEPGVAAGGVRHVPHRRLHRPRDGACAATPRHCQLVWTLVAQQRTMLGSFTTCSAVRQVCWFMHVLTQWPHASHRVPWPDLGLTEVISQMHHRVSHISRSGAHRARRNDSIIWLCIQYTASHARKRQGLSV